jgi:cell division septum initiation protein DivIVA
LELRTQQSDAEHVDLASSLVRTKVENDSLLDENESLKMQVEELRKMVDKQPQEVEDRLKGEMDKIMARNIEVQDSNRGLEEQVQEMEQELVGTKMMYAQVSYSATRYPKVTMMLTLLN